MFDLEQAVVEWRQRMLAAGIQSPVPLDELEAHLRDEIEHQLESGLEPQAALAVAIEKIGQPQFLKSEFRRSRGALAWLGKDNHARIVRILCLFWMGLFALALVQTGIALFGFGRAGKYGINLFMLLVVFIYGWGLIASVRLFKGDTQNQRLLWLMAVFFSLGDISSLIPGSYTHSSSSSWLFVLETLICFASVWYLRPTRTMMSANK